MTCPICGSESKTILKSKDIPSKKKDIKELLLRCNECNHVFKYSISQNKPRSFRLIISEQEESKQSSIDLYQDEEVTVGDRLLSDIGEVEVTSIEVSGKRVKKAIANDIITIWASSIEIPTRIGVSVDMHGKVQSYKVDISRDFKISVDDIIKIEDYIIRIHVIKTEERKTKDGFAKASVIKRIYGRPVNFKNYDYDLTKNITKKTDKIPKYLRKKLK